MKNFFSINSNKKLALISLENKGNKKNALIIYIPWAIKDWIKSSYLDNNYNGHSMHWESIEMVKILSSLEYNVDVADCTASLPTVDWTKYQLVIDERNNLKTAPMVSGQLRIYYATGCQWLFHNTAEYIRLLDFRARTGISINPERQVTPIYSEETANWTTYFGGDFQKNLFTYPNKTFPLSLSSSFIPEFKDKKISTSRQNILWLGSRGFIHKGLDIVLEAFKQQNEFNLHICTSLQAEPDFYAWYKKEFSECANIFYHGWKEVNDTSFQQLAENCIATVYCSAAEGGAGAIIQAMQFGCIPIVNDSTALRGQDTGFYLKGQTSNELVNSIQEVLKKIATISDQELVEKSAAVRTYANLNHSREVYSQSFRRLLTDTING